MSQFRRLNQFSRSLWLTGLVFTALVIFFGVYVQSEKQIDRLNELRQRSLALTYELRQSSDELTRMVRSYVLTGNVLYKKHYQEILDIRDGHTPRPENYENIYWDLVLDDDQRPRPGQQPISLLDMLRQAGFTDSELSKLAQAKTISDGLTRIEFTAMQLVESGQAVSDAQRISASMLLHDSTYQQTKASIMRRIAEAIDMVNQRTLVAVDEAESMALLFRLIFIAFGVLLLVTCRYAYLTLSTTLGGSLSEVYTQIFRLGRGDFTTGTSDAHVMHGSVLSWLSETRKKLAELDRESQLSAAKNQRLTRLYAALSQCNQAIVRCHSETELFPQICQDAVLFGGMQMAWIGMLDEQKMYIKPVACFGDGIAYLSEIEISVDEAQLIGKGPTGMAYRENQPYWCQDLLHDPRTMPWQEQSRKYGWQASAALPLHRENKVVGVFNLYASEVNAFDEAAKNLLLEMAMDISYALESFERDRETRNAREMEHLRVFMLELLTCGSSLTPILTEVVTQLESIIPGSLCSILLLDESGQYLRIGAAQSLPAFYNQAIDGAKIGAGIGSCGNTAFTGERTIVDDIANHPFWRDFKFIAEKAGLASCWSEPILTTGKKVLGTFAIYQHQQSRPEQHQLDLLEMTAHFVALAIERKRTEEHIYSLANFDTLTGLPNRALLSEHMRYAISLAKRTNGQLALMFFDLDHFKDINDTLGHSIGDALLIELARRFRLVLREEDTVTRLGGDEFIILLPGVNSQGAGQVAQKLLKAIAKIYRIEHYELSLSASIGIALYPDDGGDLESLSKSADTAMYRAKREGRQGYRFFTPEMQSRSARNLQLLNALRQALEQEQFQVFYQLQLTAKNREIIGVEALLRWQHPELGMISPAEFIPIAEDSGMIMAIGEWVLKTAVQQAKSWMDMGFPPIIMAVNISAVQFRHPNLPDMVTQIVTEAAFPAEYLELELTESVAMHNPEDAIAIINNLYLRGVRMSIDDFGTGYSSLNHLKKFKVYKLKIDQSFVRDIGSDPDDRAIVVAIIGLASSLGLKTIAEGVETLEQLTFLQQQGCDEMQGYLFSKPVPADEFLSLLGQGYA